MQKMTRHCDACGSKVDSYHYRSSGFLQYNGLRCLVRVNVNDVGYNGECDTLPDLCEECYEGILTQATKSKDFGLVRAERQAEKGAEKP